MGTNVFKLNADGDYEITKIIPSREEVKKQVPEKILKYFNGDATGESKMHRIGISNPNDASYVAYNNAVEQYRAEADAEIASNEAYLSTLTETEIDNGGMTTKIMVIK